MIAEFEIQGLPKIVLNSRGHWRKKHRENTKWKVLVISSIASLRLNEQERAALPLKRASLCLTRYSSNEPDFDGLVSSFKHVIDGLKEAGVIVDDKMSVIGQPKYFWLYAKPKQGKIKVRIEKAAA